MNLKHIIQQQEEAFDKDMSFKLSSCGDEECNSCKEDKKLHEDFKSFLHSSTQAILRGVVEEIEKMEEDTYHPNNSHLEDRAIARNGALSDVIIFIKEGLKE